MEKAGNSQASDQLAMAASHGSRDSAQSRQSEQFNDTKDITGRGQEPRFGFTNIGSTGSVRIPINESISI